jgi:hypothetical protein
LCKIKWLSSQRNKLLEIAAYFFGKQIMKKLFILAALIIIGLSATAFGQWKDVGKLDAWTLATISRQNNDSSETAYLKNVRVGKNKGFDRIVFEFTGDIPRYQINFVKAADLIATGEDLIKVGGKFFIEVDFQMMPYPEPEDKIADVVLPKGNQKLPIFNEVKEIEWFEGYRSFAIGLNAKKQFRVSQLKNPTRLVIDFKQ